MMIETRIKTIKNYEDGVLVSTRYIPEIRDALFGIKFWSGFDEHSLHLYSISGYGNISINYEDKEMVKKFLDWYVAREKEKARRKKIIKTKEVSYEVYPNE